MAIIEPKVQIKVELTPDQHAKLRKLAEVTRVPMAHFVREGIDLLLAREEKGTCKG